MWLYIYKKLVIDFSKLTLLLISAIIVFSLYQAKNFNLDASSDALLLEGDKDLKYLREINDRYGSKDFLVLTYTPVTSFEEKETILNLQLLKSKIEKLTWVDSVITIIDVPLLKSTDESLMDRLKNYKTLAYPEVDKKRGFEEIVNSPIYKNYVISEDGKTSGIVVYLKKDERLAEYIKIKDKYFDKSNEEGLTKDEKRNFKAFTKEYEEYLRQYGDNARAIPTVNLFTIKQDMEGNPVRAKSRIVVLGNLERRIWSREDRYAPVLSGSASRLLLSMAIEDGRRLKQGDCKNAFCNGILPDDEICIVRPPQDCPRSKKGIYWKHCS